jgi:stalled ribosome rescue protein Dom34
MQPHFHAIVWIDHQQAKVFHVGLSGADQVDLHPHLQTRHIHHKANSIGSGHVHEDKELMQGVADAVSDAGEILIIGPAGTKTELAKYLREHKREIGERIVGVEAADHPSDREIVACAKKHFKIGTLRAAPSAGH